MKKAEVNPGALILALFIVILAAYIVYIMMIHPWERKALLTQQAIVNVNVVDCSSGYPINNAKVLFYSEEDELLFDTMTVDGVASYIGVPDCLRIKASYKDDVRYDNICVPSGGTRVVNLCYDYPEANPSILYYNDYVGVIGGTSGEVVSRKVFSNFLLSYPLSNATVSYPSYFLYSNLLWSEGMRVVLSNINKSFTKDVDFQFNVESVRGSPIITVYVNNQLFYEDSAVPGEIVHVLVPSQSLNETLNVEVKCSFNGLFFWTTQDCNLTGIKAVQGFYTPKRVSQEFIFSASSMELNASRVELGFTSLDNVIGGVNVLLNDVLIFDSNSLIKTNYSASVPLSELNLSGSNKLVFNANPGAEVWVSNVSLVFTTPVTPKEKETLLFLIASDDFALMSNAVINFFISNVYYNGEVLIRVNDVVYVSTNLKAGWNSVSIDKEDLSLENTLELSTLSGRYEIGELKITRE